MSESQTWLPQRSQQGAVLGVSILLLFAFHQVLLLSGAFFYRDYGFLGYPFAYYNQQSFLNGEFPHWNSLIHCGVPYFAQWNTMTLYPGSLIFALFPLPQSLAWFCVLHLLLGAAGMYRLGWRQTESRLAAAFGAVSYPFGGLLLGCVIYPNYLVAFGWLPWLYLALQSAWREGGRHLVTAVLIGTMQMLSGAPELILMSWVMLGALMLAEVGINREALRSLGRFVSVVALVAGLSAFQLLPFFELLELSQRHVGTGTGFWSLPGWGWINFVLPLFGSFQTMQGVWVQVGQSFLPTVYLGAPIVALALAGILGNRRREQVTMAAFALLWVLLAFGSWFFLYGLLSKLIPVGFARYPVKAILPLAFVVPWLAMFGIRELETRRVWIGAALVTGVIVLGLAWNTLSPLVSGDQQTVWINGAIRLLLLLATIWLLRPKPGLSERMQKGLPLAGLAFIALDGVVHTPILNPTIDASSFTPSLTRMYPDWGIDESAQSGRSRIMLRPAAENAMHTRMVPKFADDFLGQRLAQWGNLNILDGIPKVNGAATLLTRWGRDVEAGLYGPPAPNDTAMMDFLGVSHVTKTNELIRWQKRSGALPLVTAGQEIRTNTFTRQIADWNPRKVVYRSDKTLPAANAQVGNLNYRHGNISFTVSSDAPTVAVIAEGWYPAWQAEVNGKLVPVRRANHAFMSVDVPAGDSTVKLYFADRAMTVGVWISLGTLLLCAWIRRRDRPVDSTQISETGE